VTEQRARPPRAANGAGAAGAGDTGIFAPVPSDYYPGKDLGLPKTGRGSVGRIGRRLGALFADWILCTFIVVALIRPHEADVGNWTLLVFAAQDFVLTSLAGFTVGKRLFGIRVVKLDGTWVGPIWGFLRTLLLLFLVPAVVLNRDQRGLHDRATNTVVIRV
jgi:uncharacterized RDD family membrane protein YckC